jgi:FMN phosphatase YigB (HAD superfamily)
MMSKTCRLLISDVDNTLYDWVAFYVPSFRALVSEISRVSRVPEDQLWPSFRRLHQKHGTTEYPFAIQEIDALDDVDRGLSPRQRQDKYQDGVRAFRHLRRTLLRPYPGVPEGLARLHERGILLAAHSDSMTVPVSRRLRQLGIDNYFDAIFGSQDVGIPHYLGVSDVRKASEADVGARVPVLELPPGVRKPDPASLLPVLAHFGIPSDAAVYLGDSLRRDVALARSCDVRSIWARYGARVDAGLAVDLGRISYWTDAQIEGDAQSPPPSPWRTVDSFSDAVDLFLE